MGVHVGLPFVMEWFVGHSGKTKPTLAGGGANHACKKQKKDRGLHVRRKKKKKKNNDAKALEAK